MFYDSLAKQISIMNVGHLGFNEEFQFNLETISIRNRTEILKATSIQFISAKWLTLL